MTYEEIEKEIGISLSKIYEAVTKGVWLVNFHGFNKDRSPIVTIDFIASNQMFFAPSVNFISKEITSTKYTLRFDDYGKTWSLDKNDLTGE